MAAEVFKGAADPEAVIFVIQGKIDDWEGRIGIINKPPFKEISPLWGLARFKQRYKQFPKIGMRVDVVANDTGYWKLQL